MKWSFSRMSFLLLCFICCSSFATADEEARTIDLRLKKHIEDFPLFYPGISSEQVVLRLDAENINPDNMTNPEDDFETIGWTENGNYEEYYSFKDDKLITEMRCFKDKTYLYFDYIKTFLSDNLHISLTPLNDGNELIYMEESCIILLTHAKGLPDDWTVLSWIVK